MGIKKIRFFSILIALLISGFAATSLIGYYVAHDSMTDQIEETTLPLTSDNIYSEIQRDLLNPIFISSLMAQDTFVRDWTIAGEVDETAIIRYLGEIQKRYGTVTSFFVSEKTKNYYHPDGIIKKVSIDDPQDLWYFRVRNLNEDYEVNVDTDTADKNSINIFINYRVFDYSRRFIGVTGVGLAVSSVKQMISSYQTRYGREVYFINSEGFVTLNSSDNSIPYNIRQKEGIKHIATQILTSPGYRGTYEKNGRTVFLNSRIVPEFNWYLIVEQLEDDAGKRIQKTLFINIGISLFISLIILFFAFLTIRGYQRRLEEMASTDELTGAANRQVFDMIFDQILKTSRRRREPMSIIICDLDNFKAINDEYGHQAGDFALKSFADTVREESRSSDVLCRWGGDEFLLLLADCDVQQAQLVAEKIRNKVESHSISYKNREIHLTISIGLSELDKRDDSDSLFKRADDALYVAKEKGRNRVEKL